jgi:small conductance mechanosensitive channel
MMTPKRPRDAGALLLAALFLVTAGIINVAMAAPLQDAAATISSSSATSEAAIDGADSDPLTGGLTGAEAALDELSRWVGMNILPLLIGFFAYLVLQVGVRRLAAREQRRARALFDQVEPDTDRLEEAQGVERTAEEERAQQTAREERERRNQELATRARDIERGANRFRDIASLTLNAGITAFVLFMFISESGFQETKALRSPEVLGQIGTLVGQHLIKVALIIFGLMLLMRLVRAVTGRIDRAVTDDDDTTMTEVEMRAHTLVNVINSTAGVVLVLLGTVMILQVLGAPIAPVLAGVGIVGLAIGFGAQSLVKDFISGFFLLVENHYRVGDVVKIADIGGLVEKITLRATYLRDLSGSVHIIPNGQISTVTNMTFKWSRHVAEIGVAYGADPDKVIEILRDVGAQMRREEPWDFKMSEDPEVLGLDQFADSALIFKVILKTRPLQQWAVGREYKRRIFYAFKKAGIEIPFPHRTTYLRMEEGESMRFTLDQAGAPIPVASAEELMGKRTPHIPKAVAEESGQSDLSEEDMGPPR